MKGLAFLSWLPIAFINRKRFGDHFSCIKVLNYKYRFLKLKFRTRCERKKSTLLEDYKNKMFSAFTPSLCCFSSQSQNVAAKNLPFPLWRGKSNKAAVLCCLRYQSKTVPPKTHVHSWSLKNLCRMSTAMSICN